MYIFLRDRGYNIPIHVFDDLLNALYVYMHQQNWNALYFDMGKVKPIFVEVDNEH